MPDAVIHPTPQELSAFSLGRLSDAAAAVIAGHLEDCPACRNAVENAGPDSFVSKVRAAKPGDSSLPPGASPPLTTDASSVAKTPATCPPEDLPPELANHPKYRIIRELGRGGMGVVYQAMQTLMDRTVAVKVINPSVLEHRDSLARFQAEVKAAAKLDHANIVRAHDADQVGGLHLLVMEFVQGMSLADLVSHKGPLPIAHACHFIRQAALGLQHAFEQGMVHRDIKPQNLMVTPKGQVKILDFGLARLRSESAKGGGLTDVGAFMGTPEYVSPEQATDARTADTRADLYSLGCTLYFLLTGWPPFQEATVVKTVLAQIEKEAPAVQELRADVPAELSAVVARLLAKDPAQRYQTPIELAQALVPLIKAGAKGSAPAVTASPPPAASPAAGTLMRRDTSKMPGAREEQAGKAAAPEAPGEAEPFKDLAAAALPKNVKKAPTVARPGPAAWYRRWRVLAGSGVAALILGLVGLWAAGVIRVTTPHGTIILQNVPDDAEVKVEGPTVTITRNGEVVTVTAVSEGPYQLKVMRGGQEIWCSGEVKIKLAGDPIRLKAEPRDAASPGTISPTDGFVPLFNGKDLTGWVRRDGQPAAWRVLDGVLEVVPGQLSIMTTQSFGPDFQLHAEFNIPLYADRKGQARGNSGIFLLGRYEIQILDSYDNPQSRELACAALYDQIGPSRNVCKPPNEWQTFDITFRAPRLGVGNTVVEGGELTVVHNGVIVIEKGRFDSPTRGGLFSDVATKGPIMLQDHGSAVRFRNLRLKPLDDRLPSKPKEEAGFVPLFNGKDLSSWKTHPKQPGEWRVKDGVLTGSGAVSHLFTERGDFKDFHLRAEVRVNEDGNSGIYFRTPFGLPLGDDASPGGYEAQILHRYDKPAFLTGSLQGLVKAPILALAADEWFTMEITAVGNELTVKVNNKTTAHYVDEKRTSMQGHFALQVWQPATTVVQFRKIEIKELPPTINKSEAAAAADGVENDAAKIAKLKQVLVSHAWHYHDNLYPPGDTCRFNTDGTFHRWRWSYWVVGPRTMRVHYDRNNHDKESGIPFTFNEDLTEFRGVFTDPNGRVHKIIGTRQ
jgi:hypothetical protein